LQNRKYIGFFEYGKIKRPKSKDPRYKTQRIVDENSVKIENGVPAIIGRELFDLVQTRFKTRPPDSKATVDYLLRGRIKCGYCGSNFVGSMRQTHGRKEPYYICSKKNQDRSCGNRAIKKETLEGEILKFMREDIHSAEGIAWIQGELIKYNETAQELTPQETETLKNRIAEISRRQERAKEGYLNGVLDLREYNFEKQKAADETKLLTAELSAKQPVPYDEETIRQKLGQLKNTLLSDKELIQSLLRDVAIKDERISVNLFSYRGLAQ